MRARPSKPKHHRLVVLFDVDNTLLDNDRVVSDLRGHLLKNYGQKAERRYFEIFEQLRSELGYTDYLGALQRYRLEHPGDPYLLRMSSYLVNYPFKRRLFPQALAVVQHCARWGRTAILSDGDAVFQPHKVEESGLWEAVHKNVLIFIHKEKMLKEVERLYPADHYVMVEDKLRILDAMKRIWKDRLTTIFVKQGHYAWDTKALKGYRPADITLRFIRDLLTIKSLNNH